MRMHESTKRFTGYSTCFRQWRADSHCQYLHGYALEFVVTFEGKLDDRNWVMDFGCFKPNGFKDELGHWFDHTTVIAADDPYLETFQQMYRDGIVQLRTMDHVGCEKFAEFVKLKLDALVEIQTKSRVMVKRVQCIETLNNTASCYETNRY